MTSCSYMSQEFRDRALYESLERAPSVVPCGVAHGEMVQARFVDFCSF